MANYSFSLRGVCGRLLATSQRSTMISRDKLWHFLASLGLVWLFFGLLTAMRCYCFGSQNDNHNGAGEHDGNRNTGQDINDNQGEEQVTNEETHDERDTNNCPAKQQQQQHRATLLLRVMPSTTARILLASLLSFLVGAAKEIADVVWNGWPWCKNGVCQGDGWDILANLVGIVVGAGLLVTFLRLVNRMQSRGMR